ncbi:hypothetical protein JW710_00575 [Candidatus Dojkabacteria bacterium]|nr:hypothetical protein [Candidatus Dojkabacteria bacterium]
MNNIPLITLISAAAIDSINPCAIGVLVFMITFLTSIKGSRRKLLSIGFTYISVVYICYFAAGAGLVRILAGISFLDIIYKIVGIIVLVAGLVEIRDGIVNAKKPLLAIPKSASPRIKKYIKKSTIPAAVVLGGIVSLFELPCTGGPYIAILSMISRADLKLQGMLYLALYNLIFVLPLITILLMTSFGLSSEKVEDWRKKHKSTMRILIGISMLVLAGLMLSDTI